MSRLMTHDNPGQLVAVLGPTNTGKTHLAVERMLAHRTGMIGLPLRLLAREVFDRVSSLVGPDDVALVTGEERIVPPKPRFWVCTVEAMPISVPVEFLAVDEVQLAADPERGHTFTDRLIAARGTRETMFLGSDTVRPLLRRLLPGIRTDGRPRLSTLSFAGHHKLSRLPRRAAVIAYRAEDVYAIAEFLRRQKGGAAVVMGALSPRTRNAQVGLFEAGEVDYLVATDAIGMGLNLGIDHVAFASLRKFDGQIERRLTPAEIGQVAGRAGRHLNPGTFGTTGEAEALADDVIEAVESHSFAPLTRLRYRNAALDFSSVPGLITSLEVRPHKRFLQPAMEASDLRTLRSLYREADIARAVRSPANVPLLWQVSTIPDFQQMLHETHTNLLGQIFRYLIGPSRRLPSDFLARNIGHLDRATGDIDTLQTRLAHIRTWTYIAHQRDWVDDALDWQARAIAVEDRLSDALHARLTQRFVDRQHVAALRRLRESGALAVEVDPNGAVQIDGARVGTLRGLRFISNPSVPAADHKAIRRELRSTVVAHAMELSKSNDQAFEVDGGVIRWRGNIVARLARGDHVLRPALVVVADDVLLGVAVLTHVSTRLVTWLEKQIAQILGPLIRITQLDCKGAGRGLVFQIGERLGVVRASDVHDLVAALSPQDRTNLKRHGVKLGRYFVYMPALLKRRRTALALELACVFHSATPQSIPVGRVSFEAPAGSSDLVYNACGYWLIGGRAVRVDALERLGQALAVIGPTAYESPELLSLIGYPRREFPIAMNFVGYRKTDPANDAFTSARPPAGVPKNRRGREQLAKPSSSPFSVLRDLSPRGGKAGQS